MALRPVNTSTFETKAEATKWAKEQKKRAGPDSGIKYDINRLNEDHPRKWEAVIFRDV